MLLIASIVTDEPQLFAIVVGKLEMYALEFMFNISTSYEVERTRTDNTMRELVEYCLQAAIVTGNQYLID